MANIEVDSEIEIKIKDNNSIQCNLKKEFKDNIINDNESNGDSASRDDITMTSVDNDQYHTGSYQLDMLPDEMLDFILSYLPPYRDLEMCSLVCKRWHGLVKNLIRRRKLALHKGLVDFRLRWQVCRQQNDDSYFENHLKSGHSTMTATIAGRFSHSAVRYKNSMYIFGGGSSSDTTFNDLWRFDLSEMRWERPLSMGSYPSPKGSATMVCWRNQLILYGGWRYPSIHPGIQPWCLFDELHYYNLSTNRWKMMQCIKYPPPLAGHSATVHADTMVVFGGYQVIEGVNSNSNETWCLNLKMSRWWQPRFHSNVKPPPRYGQFQLALDEQHLLIIGGCGGPNSIYSDAWLLDMTGEFWIWKPIAVRNKKFAASHMWCNPACKVDSKLVVLGPTPNMPQDFQLMKQTRVPTGRGAIPFNGNPIAPANNNQRNHLIEPERPYRFRADLNVGVAPQIPELAFPALIRLAANNNNRNRLQNIRLVGAAAAAAAFPADDNPGNFRDGSHEQYLAQRRRILNNHQQNARNNNVIRSQQYESNTYNNNNNNNNSSNGNNNMQPRVGSLKDLRCYHSPNDNEDKDYNRPSSSSRISTRLQRTGSSNDLEVSRAIHPTNDDLNQEAVNRLQRNLGLRCRENEPILPKRFDELHESGFCMAAFNVPNRQRSLSKDHNERIRRMEEKMNALRNSRRVTVTMQKTVKEPSPKRIKRNVLSLFVCELSNAMADTEPYVEWLEYKNYGVMPGAPERLILSTMIHGHGELILFGGVHKETLSEVTHQVSNTVHFLTAPHDIV